MEVVFPDGARIHVRDVIVLARKSRTRKGRAETSIESQDEDARDWADEQDDLNVIATVPDYASGKKAMWERPNARPWVTQPDLMAKYQGIVVSKHDRLSRADWRDEGDLRRWAEDNHKALFLVEKELRWPPRQGAHYDDDVANWNREAEASNREWINNSLRWKRANRKLISDNYVTGRAPYGYRIMGVDCREVPCRCFEKKIDDHKTLTIWEPEAKIVREIVERYLAGETVEIIAKTLNARGEPAPVYRGAAGKEWYSTTIAKMLRSPSIAGRRMDNYGKPESERKTILKYERIITWQMHLELVKKLDSKAHRKGVSPANVYMLSGILNTETGRRMRGHVARGGRRPHPYYYYYAPGFMIRMDQADEEISQTVIADYGELPYLEQRIIPGVNHFNQIQQLRQDRNELDVIADDYEQKDAAIVAEIRRLTKFDKEQPDPDTAEWVGKDAVTGVYVPWKDILSGRKVIKLKEHWTTLSPAGRRDWLKKNGWQITGIKDDNMPNGWRLAIDAGWMEDIGASQQLMSLSFPIMEYYQGLEELPEQFRALMAESKGGENK
jgi:hypothetical protein